MDLLNASIQLFLTTNIHKFDLSIYVALRSKLPWLVTACLVEYY
jgi:hypothetical protein